MTWIMARLIRWGLIERVPAPAVPEGVLTPAQLPPGERPPDPRRHWGPRRWVKWVTGAAVAALIFRRAAAWLAITALAAAGHLAGVSLHLPDVKFAWPWQTAASAPPATTTDIGPWVLQKIEGISRPALGQASYAFLFTHKVDKSVAFWPCWYAATFSATARASATVNLNPGPAWWAPGAGHYLLRILSAPAHGAPGHVSVAMTLPVPQLPTSAHQVAIDNLGSRPLNVSHSWTYPGVGCGVLMRPQFDTSVLFALAQRIAYWKALHAPAITGPLIRAAEAQAQTTIRDSFIQPAVNAFGYNLSQFTLNWATPPTTGRTHTP